MPDPIEQSSLHYWIDFSALYQRSDAISHAYKSGNLVFFLGSGASKAYASTMPNWRELLNAVLAEVRFSQEAQRKEIQHLIRDQKYLLAAEAIKRFALLDSNDKDLAVDGKLTKILQQRLPKTDGDPILHLAILDFATPVITTNFDPVIEVVINRYGVPGYSLTPITYEDQNDAARHLNPTLEQESFLLKIHGTISKVQRLIFDEGDYAAFYFQGLWPKPLQLLRHLLATKMVVFIGFSMSDPEVMLILREATRYASSYQHLALIHEEAITSIEQEILRDNYRVEPILYQTHRQLPILVMKMRNFNRREDLPLQIRSDRETLLRAARILQEEAGLEGDVSSVVLFGSYAKYGQLTHPEADVDMLFLTSVDAPIPSIRSAEADAVLKRKVDVTVMARTTFERLLRSGDTFASSILVTGSPLEDAEGGYGVISRGFLPSYTYKAVHANALERYKMRWLRLVRFSEGVTTRERLKACHQWAVTLMQFLLMKNGYRIDSVLSLSLLGNARYTIRRFATQFEDVDEDFFLTIMRGGKGLLSIAEQGWPSIEKMAALFLKAVGADADAEDVDLLLPGEALPQASVQEIGRFYWELSDSLVALSARAPRAVSEYAVEDGFLTAVDALSASEAFFRLTTFDWLFMFRLHEVMSSKTILKDDERGWKKVAQDVLKEWERTCNSRGERLA